MNINVVDPKIQCIPPLYPKGPRVGEFHIPSSNSKQKFVAIQRVANWHCPPSFLVLEEMN